MSYDLLVFEPSAAPREREEFVAWYRRQTEWDENTSSLDATHASEALQRWYVSMLEQWPNMQDPALSDEKIDDNHITGYSITKDAIYLDFRWSVAEEAYDAVRRSAVEQQVGFYDVSGDAGEGEIYFPGDEMSPPSDGVWRDVASDFKELG